MRLSQVLICVLLAFLFLSACTSGVADGPTPEEATLIHVGDLAPDFHLETLSGDEFSLSGARGELVLISFFATWCPPCRQELPRLERDVWQKLQGPGLRLLAIGREETPEKLRPFVEKMGLTFPVGADSDRSIYSKYADVYIPRLFLIGRDGKVLWESSDFDESEFSRFLSFLEKTLADHSAVQPQR